MACEMRGEDVIWMGRALDLARKALAHGEFPVGAVLVSQGQVVGEGRRMNAGHTAGGELDHAEVVALRAWAAASTGEPPPGDLTLYATLEPCLMCLGAALLSGVRRIVYAYEDVMGGACGTEAGAIRSRGAPASGLYAGCQVAGGVMRAESLALFKQFFREQGDDGYWQGSLLCRYTMETR